MPESQLVQFYRGTGKDHAGRGLLDILSWPDTQLEFEHDYIQWLFPLLARSHFNPDAPCLTEADIAAFQSDTVCRQNLLRAFRRILSFYGFTCDDSDPDDIYIAPALTFDLRCRVWLNPNNHNYLRLTRILTSLRLLGCRPYAEGLFQCLKQIYLQHGGKIGQETFKYWRNTIES
jgi:hypothetical protein